MRNRELRLYQIKCDESPNGCVNCDRIDVACPGYGAGQMRRNERNQLQSKNSSVITEAGIKRSRILRSCNECRQAKTKCTGDGSPCSRCRTKNLPCIFEKSKSTRRDDRQNTQVTSDQQNEFDGVHQEYCSGNNTIPDGSHWSGSVISDDSSLSWFVLLTYHIPSLLNGFAGSCLLHYRTKQRSANSWTPISSMCTHFVVSVSFTSHLSNRD